MPESPPQGLYIGIDFGTQKMGFATGQTITCTASPLKTLHYQNKIGQWDAIDSILLEWRPAGAVVGLPLNADGSLSTMAKRCQKFCHELEKRYKIPVFTVNEHLSSFAAREKIKKLKASQKTKVKVDDVAAAIILQTWFDQHF